MTMKLELKQLQQKSNMPPQLRRYLQTCQPSVAEAIHAYLDGDPHAIDEMIEMCANRASAPSATVPPELSHNQHPMYERWKSICPACDSIHTRHIPESGSAEFHVRLQCTDCGRQFTLKEGFEAQLAKSKKDSANVQK